LSSGTGALLAVLYDPEAVTLAERVGIGAALRLRVGGKTDGLHGKPIEGEFTVVDLREGTFQESETRHGGYSHFDQGRTTILRSRDGLTVMATTLRMPPLSLQQLLAMGLKPEDYAAIVIKGVHAPVAAYGPVCSRMIRVNTPGSTSADPTTFRFENRRKPMFPFEENVSLS
jgi:microcystin degradation protein MlrC